MGESRYWVDPTRPDPTPRPLQLTDLLPVAVADDGVFKLSTTPQRTRRRVKFAVGPPSPLQSANSQVTPYIRIGTLSITSLRNRGLGLRRSKPAGHHTTPLAVAVWVLKQATTDDVAHFYDSSHSKEVLYGNKRLSQLGIALKHPSLSVPARPWPEPIITNPLSGFLHSSLIFVPRYSKPF